MLAIRLLKMRAIQTSITDGKKALTTYYLIFMLGYISRVGADVAMLQFIDYTFAEEMIYTWCSLIWDGIPIMCLLLFHYQNFKPH